MRSPRDFDSAGRAQNLRAGVYSALAGVIFAFLGARLFGALGFVIGWVVGALILYFLITIIAGGAGNAISRVYLTSGSSTPKPREYSLGDALVSQGKLEDAVREFERAAAMYPDDPEPRLRLARLYRDQLHHVDRAEYWFQRVMQMPAVDAATETLAARELVELYTHRVRQPERALPILARLAARHKGSPTGDWARTELQSLKQRVRRDSANE